MSYRIHISHDLQPQIGIEGKLRLIQQPVLARTAGKHPKVENTRRRRMALAEYQLAVVAIKDQKDSTLRDRNAQNLLICARRCVCSNREHIAAGVPERVDRPRRNILVGKEPSRHALPGRSFRLRG